MGLPRWTADSARYRAVDELAQSGERAIATSAHGPRESFMRFTPHAEHLPAMDALGVPIAICAFDALRPWLLGAAESRGRYPKVMLFAGARSIAHAAKDVAHRARLLRADVVLGEGRELAAYATLAAAPMHERFDAVATLERLFASVDPTRPVRVFLCGEDHTRTARAAVAIAQRFPSVTVVGAVDARRNASLSEDVNESCADIVLVGMGDGRGEAWIEENLALLDVGVVVGVGDALETLAGERRAPVATRPLGLFGALTFMIRATLYLAFPPRRVPASALNG